MSPTSYLAALPRDVAASEKVKATKNRRASPISLFIVTEERAFVNRFCKNFENYFSFEKIIAREGKGSLGKVKVAVKFQSVSSPVCPRTDEEAKNLYSRLAYFYKMCYNGLRIGVLIRRDFSIPLRFTRNDN